MTLWWRALVPSVLAIAALLSALPSRAQDYPSRTIRFIVPFGAGGPTDVFTRAIAEELRKELNQPYMLDNRPGAGTIIGTAEAARAAPDGYTLLMVSATQTTVETLNPNKPYKLMRDFVPVAALMNSELVMVVHPSVPVNGTRWDFGASYAGMDAVEVWNGPWSGFNQTTYCTLADAEAAAPDATIYSVEINKGRDFAFSGAVDDLQLDSTVYDFEPNGVIERPAH